MRILNLDQRGPGGKLISFGVWNGIATPEGHLKMIIKVTLTPKNGMLGESKYHREDVKWDGTTKGFRRAIIAFLSRGRDRDKEFDIRQAMYTVKQLFV